MEMVHQFGSSAGDYDSPPAGSNDGGATHEPSVCAEGFYPWIPARLAAHFDNADLFSAVEPYLPEFDCTEESALPPPHPVIGSSEPVEETHHIHHRVSHTSISTPTTFSEAR
jgi:hypothetical protein